MMPKIFFLLFVFVAFFFASVSMSYAQDFPILQEQIPQPFVNLFQSLSGLKIGFSASAQFVERIVGNIVRGEVNPEKVMAFFKDLWDKVNAWIQNTIGLNLKEVLRAIGGVIVWVLEFVVKLLKEGVSRL